MEKLILLIMNNNTNLYKEILKIIDNGCEYSFSESEINHMKRIWNLRNNNHGEKWDGVRDMCIKLNQFNEDSIFIHNIFPQNNSISDDKSGYWVFTDKRTEFYIGYVKSM